MYSYTEHSKFKIRPQYVGTWISPVSDVTVRTEPMKRHYAFTKGKADFELTIHGNGTASGHIGNAKFENAKLEKNWGLPYSWTGIIYVAECGKIGKIFDADPVEEKEVELWIGLIKSDGTMEVELRYGLFPMAGFETSKR
jgi:hypothetical protein